MNRYKRYKTTLGHRYTMRMCEDEIQEKMILRAAIVLAPLVAVVGFAMALGMI